MTEQMTPTTGLAWRKPRQEGYTIVLASGNSATLRPVALDLLITSGKLPDLLTPIAAKTLWVETAPSTLADQAELAKGFADLINLIVPLAMLSPRVVEQPQADDEISLDDIDFQDKLIIFQLATGGATALRSFRQRQAADLEPVSDKQSDVHSSE